MMKLIILAAIMMEETVVEPASILIFVVIALVLGKLMAMEYKTL